MTKQQMLDYLRDQSFWINQLAQEIEDGEEITCAWAVDLDLPEYQTEVVTIHEQLKLNAELHTAVEERRIGA
ncbi:hypothetical protein QFZ77_002418 [Paenibacillus sp. V4I3]|uniref:hypothetical protein n=1 Tax=Paenibacillus sp. V4I3 TaxID=3042305 RepID=UPI00278B0867|nr:hypothetical protein [Paenibacillus sp. V4I3]MDQ0873759.1 hypothetical protein [Paenibacillus sp. V4I3]